MKIFVLPKKNYNIFVYVVVHCRITEWLLHNNCVNQLLISKDIFHCWDAKRKIGYQDHIGKRNHVHKSKFWEYASKQKPEHVALRFECMLLFMFSYAWCSILFFLLLGHLIIYLMSFTILHLGHLVCIKLIWHFVSSIFVTVQASLCDPWSSRLWIN